MGGWAGERVWGVGGCGKGGRVLKGTGCGRRGRVRGTVPMEMAIIEVPVHAK